MLPWPVDKHFRQVFRWGKPNLASFDEGNPRLHGLLTEFKRLTGCAVLVNTSFNVRSEPIVCTPEDAYCCFMRTGIDVLALEDFILLKKEQPAWVESENWQEEFGLD